MIRTLTVFSQLAIAHGMPVYDVELWPAQSGACRWGPDGELGADGTDTSIMELTTAASTEACQEKCVAKSDCLAFEISSESDRCELWKVDVSVVEAAGFQCNRKPVLWPAQSGACRYGPDGKEGASGDDTSIMEVTTAASTEACQEKCMADSDCLAFESSPHTDRCELWKVIVSVVNAAGYQCNRKPVLWPGRSGGCRWGPDGQFGAEGEDTSIMELTTAASPEACQDKCMADPTCLAYESSGDVRCEIWRVDVSVVDAEGYHCTTKPVLWPAQTGACRWGPYGTWGADGSDTSIMELSAEASTVACQEKCMADPDCLAIESTGASGGARCELWKKGVSVAEVAGYECTLKPVLWPAQSGGCRTVAGGQEVGDNPSTMVLTTAASTVACQEKCLADPDCLAYERRVSGDATVRCELWKVDVSVSGDDSPEYACTRKPAV